MAIKFFQKLMILALSIFSISFWLYISKKKKKKKKVVWGVVWNNSKNKDPLNDSVFNLALRKKNIPLYLRPCR